MSARMYEAARDLHVRLDAAHFASAKTASSRNTNAFGAELHGRRTLSFIARRRRRGVRAGCRTFSATSCGLVSALRISCHVDEHFIVGEDWTPTKTVSLWRRSSRCRLQRLDPLATFADDHAGRAV